MRAITADTVRGSQQETFEIVDDDVYNWQPLSGWLRRCHTSLLLTVFRHDVQSGNCVAANHGGGLKRLRKFLNMWMIYPFDDFHRQETCPIGAAFDCGEDRLFPPMNASLTLTSH